MLQYPQVLQELQSEQKALQQLVQKLAPVLVLVVRQPERLEQGLKRQALIRQALFQFGQKLQEQALSQLELQQLEPQQPALQQLALQQLALKQLALKQLALKRACQSQRVLRQVLSHVQHS